MTTYFITGGYGFLGQYIVQAVRMHDPQAEIRVLIRTQRKTLIDLHALEPITWVQGELTEPASYADQLKGVDTVIHNAAVVSFSSSMKKEIYAANVLGTRHLAQAALDAGCTNFIFISSISALEFRPPNIADETFLPDMDAKKKYDIYGYTKRLSEIELVEMKDRLRLIILNPSVILGPGSKRVESVLKVTRILPFVPMMDYINAFVDARDVANAVILALTRGRSGERYIVSAYNISMLEFTRLLVKHIGKKSPVISIPTLGIRVLDGVVILLDLLHLNPGIRLPSQINTNKSCSNQKITNEMGWTAGYSLEQSIVDSVEGLDHE